MFLGRLCTVIFLSSFCAATEIPKPQLATHTKRKTRLYSDRYHWPRMLSRLRVVNGYLFLVAENYKGLMSMELFSDRFSWRGKTYSQCHDILPWTGVPGWRKRGKQAENQHPYLFSAWLDAVARITLSRNAATLISHHVTALSLGTVCPDKLSTFLLSHILPNGDFIQLYRVIWPHSPRCHYKTD